MVRVDSDMVLVNSSHIGLSTAIKTSSGLAGF